MEPLVERTQQSDPTGQADFDSNFDLFVEAYSSICRLRILISQHHITATSRLASQRGGVEGMQEKNSAQVGPDACKRKSRWGRRPAIKYRTGGPDPYCAVPVCIVAFRNLLPGFQHTEWKIVVLNCEIRFCSTLSVRRWLPTVRKRLDPLDRRYRLDGRSDPKNKGLVYQATPAS